jgi:hypothetical protein
MNKGSTPEELILILRAEAAASRRLANSLRDAKSVKDLNSYASALEAEAERLQRKFSPRPGRGSIKSALPQGRPAAMQALSTKRGVR